MIRFKKSLFKSKMLSCLLAIAMLCTLLPATAFAAEGGIGVYTVTADSAITGGTVSVNPASGPAGMAVTVTAIPDSGKQLVADSLRYTVNSSTYAEISATEGVYSFTLPAANVVVTAQFENISSGPLVWDGTHDVSWYTDAAPGTTTFNISSAKELAGLAYLVNTGNTFAGMTVRLTADILLNDHLSAGLDESARSWIPISNGGIVNGATVSFQGIFDGQGHMIKNIYCYDTSSTSVPVGLFGGIDKGSVICNVGVTGYIRAYRYIGGIAGLMGSYGSGDASVIENCVNYTTIIGDASGTRGVGGIVGNGNGFIRNCYNVGSVTDLYLPAGGIAGILDLGNIENCYNIGKVVSIQGGAGYQGAIVATRNSSSSTVKDCYWLDTSCTGAAPYGSGTVINVVSQTAEQMKAPEFPALLNTSGSLFLADTGSINNGYPILYWQSSTAAGITVGVTVNTPENGTVSYQAASPLSYGAKTVLNNNPAPGYILDYYTVNGERISGNYYYVTGQITVGAVFVALAHKTITVPSGGDVYSITVKKAGTALVDGALTNVTDYPVNNGDEVYQNDVLTVAIAVDTNLIVDADREYSDAHTVTAAGTTTNTANSVYTVKGDSNVELTVTPVIQSKLWTTLADTAWYTQAEPGTATFEISTAAELAGLAKLVNTGAATFEDKTVTLDADIDLVNTDGSGGIRYWGAIGTSSYSFRGTFDGADHTIKNFRTQPGVMYQGLFYTIQAATVKDVIIDGVITSGGGVGSIAYRASAGSVIENCVNNADITATSNYVGGIVGFLDASSVIDCVNNGALTGTSHVGGIVGITGTVNGGSIISGCVNNGASMGTYYVGGVIGYLDGASTVTRCLNSVAVSAAATSTSSSYGVGGIVGNVNGAGIVELCANTGGVSGSVMRVGGVAGYLNVAGSVVRNCYNTGSVTGTSNSATAATGGVVGYANNNACTVQNTYNAGTITGNTTSPYTTGVIGYAKANTNVSNNYYLNTTASKGLGYTTDNAVSKTADELNALASTLGQDFKQGSIYPVFSWQADSAFSVTTDSAISGGTITVDPAGGTAGTTVTVTVTPDSGKQLVADSLKYTVNSNTYVPISATEGVYSFTLPAANVVVTAQFEDLSPLAITNKEQLLAFAASVNGGNNFAGRTVILGGNIALDDDGLYTTANGYFQDAGTPNYSGTFTIPTVSAEAGIWTPIGSGTNPFRGTFDGGGYTVSGLYTNVTASYQGLFGYIGQGGTVKNITVSGVVAGVQYVGGIAGFVNGGTIEKATNRALIYASGGASPGGSGTSRTGQVGGIVGMGTGTASAPVTITGSINNGSVTASNCNQGGRAGGIVGIFDLAGDYGTISDCFNTADIKAYQYAGGIVGGQFASNVTISACYNTGVVTGTSSGKTYVGGIVGKSYGPIVNCYNTGNIVSTATSGNMPTRFAGIVGETENSTATITNCYSIGQVFSASSIGTSGNIVGSQAVSPVNCYYLSTTALVGAGDSSTTTAKTELELKAPAMPAVLGVAFAYDDNGYNSGYPMLAWQNGSSPEPVAHAITLSFDSAAATVSASAAGAEPGETVTITISDFAAGKRVQSVGVMDENSTSYSVTTVTENTSYTFTMGSGPVTVTVLFEDIIAGSDPYAFTVDPGIDPIWTVAVTSSGLEGDKITAGSTVTVTVTRMTGAITVSLEGIVVKDADSRTVPPATISTTSGGYNTISGGVYTFTMPESSVTIGLDVVYGELAIYTQTGRSGTPTLVKTYTREEMMALAGTGSLYYTGYDRFPTAVIGKAVQAVKLADLLGNAGVSFGEGDTFKLNALDESSRTYAYAALYGTGRYYYPNIAAEENKDAGKTPIDAMLVIKGYQKRFIEFEAGQDIDDMVCDTLNAYRFVYGQTEAQFNDGTPLIENATIGDFLKYTYAITIIKAPQDTAPKYTVAPVEDAAVYTLGTTVDGLSTMTVKSGISGLKYFGVGITPVVEHEGQEAMAFVHLRDGFQMSINVTKADFDVVDKTQAGFNVEPGDIVKVFIVDNLTNDLNFNPTILQ